MQFLICCASAQEDTSGEGTSESTSEGSTVKGESDIYDVSHTVKKGKEVILKQKEQLEEKEKSEEEVEEELEEEKKEARRQIYEQKIIEEVTTPRPITTLERELQRERFRREIMAVAGREAEVPFRLRKRFHLRASETYDDNIYLTKTDKRSDYITKVSPSILFSLDSKYMGLDANYVMDIVRYKTNTRQNGISHLLMTYIRPGNIPFFNKKRGKIGFEIQDTFQPLITSVATSEQTSRTDRTYNKLFLAADYYMSTKRTLALEYTNEYQHYKTSGLESYSYTHQTISPIFYFHIRPKWSLFTGYDYGIVDYSQGTNGSTYQHIKTGLTGTLLTKVLSHFEIGKEWRKYEDPKNGQAQKIFFKNALINKFTPYTTASLQYNHTMAESTYTSNPYYICDNINFNLEHKFTYKTIGSLGIEYIYDSYDRKTTEDGTTKNRKDQIWQPQVGLKYYFKRWLSTDLTYAYKKRTSNFRKFAYIDNTITGGVNIQF